MAEAKRRKVKSHVWNRCSRDLIETVRGKRCDGIAGIIEEGKSIQPPACVWNCSTRGIDE